MMIARLLLWVLTSLCALAATASAQMLVETEYDPALPTLKAVVGHDMGDRITSPDATVAYMMALADAAPDRMQIKSYGQTWQGRPLIYGIISSPENMARLEEIQTNLAKLGAGRGLSAAARDKLVAETPAVTWLGHSIHGNEISPADAALGLAHHLLAAKGDAVVDEILKETVVIIDPLQNPDGRARFVHAFEASMGLAPLSDRYTAEHDEPWPSGRFNQYLFDMNRDWFALTQVETKGRVTAMLDWHPVVVVDAHEMGGDRTYFFPPAADPFNPYITQDQRDKQTLIGINHARWFDQKGYAYFTREVYDAFYPGFGDSWPTLNGAIAMTYEQASARGLRFTRRDGSELTYRDGIDRHFTATLSTAEVVAKNKALFLKDYAAYRASAVSEGEKAADRYFVISLDARTGQAEALGQRLVAQGIKVDRLPAAASICGTTYQKGALVVDQAQPNGRLIGTLMSQDTPLPEDFIAEQESRRARGLDHQLYDVTAWSLPLMDGVTVTPCREVVLADATPVTLGATERVNAIEKGAFGFAVPWTDAIQAKLVVAALDQGLKAKTAAQPFTMGPRTFPRGTVIFPRAGNPDSAADTLYRLASDAGAELVALETSWVEAGPNFGSTHFRTLKAPKVALAWGHGVSPTDAGAARYVLERQLGVVVSPIRVRTLSAADLDLYNVLIVPGTGRGFARQLGSGGEAALKSFVKRGGVLVGFGSALDLFTGDMGLLATRTEAAVTEAEAPKDEEEGPAPGLALKDEAALNALVMDPEQAPETVPGVLVRAVADPDHWLSAGYDEAVGLYTGNTIYRPLNKADGTNVFRYADADQLLASGYLWEENRAQMAFKPFVMEQAHGQGSVIGFTESPVTRGYLNGLTLLVANAVLLGPANTY